MTNRNLLNIKHDTPSASYTSMDPKVSLMLLTSECKMLLNKKFCLKSSRI